jgi:FixJ family two-component response regulator
MRGVAEAQSGLSGYWVRAQVTSSKELKFFRISCRLFCAICGLIVGEIGHRVSAQVLQTLSPGVRKLSKPVVFVVDDYAPVRESFVALFESVGLGSCSFASGQAFLAACDGRQHGCAVLDVALRDMSGLEVQSHLLERQIHLPIVFVTGHGDIPTAVQAVKAGAVDFLEKPIPYELLLRAVRRAIARDAELRAAKRDRDEILARLEQLSPREREILDLVMEGYTNKMTAATLGVAAKTIEFHRANIMTKMKAHSVAELIGCVFRHSPADVGHVSKRARPSSV